MKSKYERPKAINLSQPESAKGICYTGTPEYRPIGKCVSGLAAIPSCSTGTFVYPIGGAHCSSGNYPGASCFSGINAG